MWGRLETIFEVELPRICLCSCRTSLMRKPDHRCAMMLPTAAAVTTIHPNKANLHPWLLKAGAPAAERFFRELLSSDCSLQNGNLRKELAEPRLHTCMGDARELYIFGSYLGEVGLLSLEISQRQPKRYCRQKNLTL